MASRFGLTQHPQSRSVPKRAAPTLPAPVRQHISSRFLASLLKCIRGSQSFDDAGIAIVAQGKNWPHTGGSSRECISTGVGVESAYLPVCLILVHGGDCLLDNKLSGDVLLPIGNNVQSRPQ